MGLFEQFPYTNFHELNMDWLLQKMKELALKTDDIENAFTALKEYVEQYFDDLNVQDNLRAVLDQMMQDGTFQQLFSEYINQYIDGPAEMMEYTNDAGQTTRVYWKMIPAYYEPNLYNVNGLEYAEDIARDNALTFALNAGRFTTDGTEQPRGYLRIGGVTLHANDTPTPSRGTLAYKNGVLYDMPFSMSTEDMDATGAEWACTGMACLMENGVQKNMDYDTDRHPRSWIIQNVDGSYIMACCEGRSYWSGGFSLQDIVACSVAFGYSPKFIYNLDGGGSCSLVSKGLRQNELIRNEHRAVKNIIGFKKTNSVLTDALETGHAGNIPIINNMRTQPFENDSIGMVSIGPRKNINFSTYSDTDPSGHDDVANISIEQDGVRLRAVGNWAAGPGTSFDFIAALNNVFTLFNRSRMIPAKLAYLANADDDYTNELPTGLDSGFYQINIPEGSTAESLGLTTYDYSRSLMIVFNTPVHFDILLTRVNIWYRVGTGAFRRVTVT